MKISPLILPLTITYWTFLYFLLELFLQLQWIISCRDRLWKDPQECCTVNNSRYENCHSHSALQSGYILKLEAINFINSKSGNHQFCMFNRHSDAGLETMNAWVNRYAAQSLPRYNNKTWVELRNGQLYKSKNVRMGIAFYPKLVSVCPSIVLICLFEYISQAIRDSWPTSARMGPTVRSARGILPEVCGKSTINQTFSDMSD